MMLNVRGEIKFSWYLLVPALSLIVAGCVGAAPTNAPTATLSCSSEPSRTVIYRSSSAPTNAPFKLQSLPVLGHEPTNTPTGSPTNAPTRSPTNAPTRSPTNAPTRSPTNPPTRSPTNPPTRSPTNAPTNAPTTKAATNSPTKKTTVVAGTECEDKPINICMAIDMSGSICSPPNDVGSCQAYDDTPCITKCRNTTLNKDTCCSNYKKERDFAVNFINRFASGDIHTSEQQYSLVSFSTESFTISTLTASTSDMIASVNKLKYWGGGTNTGEAIRMCYDTLKDKTDSENVIVLMTDGTPTRSIPGYDYAGHLFYAQAQAYNAKDAGMRLATVAINTGHLQMQNLISLASGDDYVIGVNSFDSLNTSIVDKLAAIVKCGDGTTTTVAESSSAVTAVPTRTPFAPPTSAPVPDLSSCGVKDFDICFAIDMSGSICSPPNDVQNCQTNSVSCIEECHEAGFSQDLCCSNYEKERNFATKFISTMDSHGGSQRFAVVSFADAAHQEISLQEAYLANYKIDRLTYTGGKTNTGEAIKSCIDYLYDGFAEHKAIVILTDGLPTMSYQGNLDHMGYAREQANTAKMAGITIMPVAINTPSTTMANLHELASDNKYVVQIADFNSLNMDKVNELVELVRCEPVPLFTSSAPIVPPTPSPVVTVAPTAAPQTDAPTFSTPAEWVMQGNVATFESGKSGWDGVYCSTGECADDSLRVNDPTNCAGGSYCWRLRDHSSGWTSKLYQYFENLTGVETLGKVVFDFKATHFTNSLNRGLRVITRCTEYFPGQSGSTDFIEREDLQCCGNGVDQFNNDQVYQDRGVEFDIAGCKRVKVVFECTGWDNYDRVWIDNIKFYTKSPRAPPAALASTPTVVLSDDFEYGLGSWNCPPSSYSFCRVVSGNSNCDGSSGSCIRLSGDFNNEKSKMMSNEFRVLGKKQVKLAFHFQTTDMDTGMKLELYYETLNDSTGQWSSNPAKKLFRTWTCGTDFAVGTTSGDIQELVPVPSGVRNMKLSLQLWAFDKVAFDPDQMYIDTVTVYTLD
ncbi:hypothetical protein ACA910_015313 [Epithemia clementina (nom. ined.)]